MNMAHLTVSGLVEALGMWGCRRQGHMSEVVEISGGFVSDGNETGKRAPVRTAVSDGLNLDCLGISDGA